MLAIPSLLAAMTIAGAFWVGVLAARRLRDWGDGQRALEEGDAAPLALAAASGAPSEDAGVRRVRARVAERLALARAPREYGSGPEREAGDVTVDGLRCGDVALIEAGDANIDGDYVIEGLLRLREGTTVTLVAMLDDAGRKRWLVGSPEQGHWLVVEELIGHGLSGEPPRNIQPPGLASALVYALERRGQASVAALGNHARPTDLTRLGTYVYRAGKRVLWVERWGAELRMAEGVSVPAQFVSFLPGS